MAYRNIKRTRLLAAIDTLFLQKGLDAVTISDVAFLARVPVGNVYYYFKTKTLMVQEALKIRLSRLQDDLSAIEKRSLSPKIQLQYFISLFLGFPKENVIDGRPFARENDSEIQDLIEHRPSLGRFITILLLDLEKNKNKEIYEGFFPTVDYILGWCSIKFIEIGSSIADAESTAIKLLNALIGACVFSLNSNIKFPIEDANLQYINFIIKTFCIEDKETSSVTYFSDYKKP